MLYCTVHEASWIDSDIFTQIYICGTTIGSNHAILPSYRDKAWLSDEMINFNNWLYIKQTYIATYSETLQTSVFQ